MKNVMIVLAAGLFSLCAFAMDPTLSCTATREGPRSDGRPGYQQIDKKVIDTRIGHRIKTTRLIGATVKTYVNVQGLYVLVVQDHDLEASSTSQGTIDNKNIDLSLSGRGISNYVKCEIR